jgi:hypothetical protein
MIERSYLASHWQLARWHTGQTVCDIYSRLDGQPAVEEVTTFVEKARTRNGLRPRLAMDRTAAD